MTTFLSPAPGLIILNEAVAVWACYITLGLWGACGLICVLASAFNWKWFFTAPSTRRIAARIGLTKTRWLYALLGLILIGMTLYALQQSLTATV